MSEHTNTNALGAAINPLDGATLDDVLAILLSYKYKDFYALLISSLPRRIMTAPGFMMGVSFEKGHHTLLYNEEWVEKMLARGPDGFAELRATIAHEAMHIVLLHIARQCRLAKMLSGKEEELKRFLSLSNYATDAACNELLLKETTEKGTRAYTDLDKNEKNWIFPDTIQLPTGLTYDWYIDRLMEQQKQKEELNKGAHSEWSKIVSGDGTGDDANGDGMGGLTPEELEEVATQAEIDGFSKVKQAVDSQKNRGTVPGFIEQELDKMLLPPKIRWKQEMSMWIANHRRSKPVRTLQRPRRRLANLGTTPFPGRKRNPTFRIRFSIDTSGSMSEEDIIECLAELQGILKTSPDIIIDVVEFDTQIHYAYTLNGKDVAKINNKMHGRGGTDFNEAFEDAQEAQKKGLVDAFIVATDGYAPPPDHDLRLRGVPVLWLVTSNGVNPCEEDNYGRVVKIDGKSRNHS